MTDQRAEEFEWEIFGGPRKGRPPGSGKPPAHGTRSGYNRHTKQRSGEWSMPACQPCLDAEAAHKLLRYHERRLADA